MKITVDLAVCQGYARRAFLALDAFRIYGEEAFLYSPQPGDQLRERVLQAAGACPVRAMAVENALMMPATRSTITSTFPESKRTRAVSIWAAVAGGAGIFG